MVDIYQSIEQTELQVSYGKLPFLRKGLYLENTVCISEEPLFR